VVTGNAPYFQVELTYLLSTSSYLQVGMHGNRNRDRDGRGPLLVT
jgi:hypothetical protein